MQNVRMQRTSGVSVHMNVYSSLCLRLTSHLRTFFGLVPIRLTIYVNDLVLGLRLGITASLLLKKGLVFHM